MINFVSTKSHQYTHAFVERELKQFRRVSYGQLLRWQTLPPATYIFSDFDRLNFWQLELASRAYRALRDAGCRVINDPGCVPHRLTLLQTLHREGINSFKAWPAFDWALVDRFPVFLRSAPAHRGNLSDRLYDQRSLKAALDKLIEEGWPLANLIVIEFCSEPIRDDVYRKLAMYRIGDEFVSVPSVHERNWTAKYGEEGVAGEIAYDEDLRLVQETRYQAELKKAFDSAGIYYGRADFGVVGGRVEVYEINTNPYVRDVAPHRFPARVTALNHTRTAYLAALSKLDSPVAGLPAARIPLPQVMRKQRRVIRWLRGQYWVP